jgi:hypothetical protein
MNRQNIMNRLIIVPTALLAVIVIVLLQGGGLVQQAQAGSNKTLMVSSNQFIPASNTTVWQNFGNRLRGTGFFWAPVQLPNKAKITSVTMYAHDSNAILSLCLSLFMEDPTLGTYDGFGTVCTEGAHSDGVLALPIPLISRPTARHTYQPFLQVQIDEFAPSLAFWGVTITYVMS